MPSQIPYSVTFPDGHIQKFDGPDSMSDVDVQNRAIQERAFAEGHIPTTFFEGAKKSAGETIADQSGKVGAAVSLGGMLAGQPEIVAAGPAVGRATQALGEHIAGNPITPTSGPELLKLGLEGAAAGYGPELAANWIRWFADSTVAHQLPNGRWVQGLKGSGVVPWAIRTAAEVSQPVADALEKVTPKAVGAATTEDVKSVAELVAGGMGVSAAVKQVAGTASKFGSLMTDYLKSKFGP